ncbi:heavy metal translocating P-type ATPase [Pollutimonas sp. M17]|uniref:heavy metal translocating P-type ATPase n=1 Tax=Pollutimonas sp. M17 TaxID=2962065 RepID=UPI0021F4BD96|nr:heavy metal translocating P-type ATPase [Pollutimonas sp. M17]UYO94919.1 heavy metal translocating P-type ATPase [Pollutimonas sp. M17]
MPSHHHSDGPAGGDLSFSCCSDHGHGDQGAQARASGGSRMPSWLPLAAGGAAALSAEGLGWFNGPEWAAMALALVAILLSGLDTYRSGIASIAKGDLNINALMSIAVTGAVVLGHWPEAAMVMVLFAIAEHIEARSLEHARHAVDRLMQVAPATVWARDAEGSWAGKAASDVIPGDLLRVRPGERIGLDGLVERGSSAVNQAPITGESMPVKKSPGDTLYAGSVNGMAELEYRATARFDQTMLARIIHAVRQAQGSKAPIQRFVDRFARIYTPIVCLIALLIAVVPPLLTQGTWSEWGYRALVLLVIACPCALVISTPVAIVSGLAAAARHGILVKGGVYLEQGRKLAWLALDKTGTLTHGQPRLVDTVVLAARLDAPRAHQLAASLASRSDHPASQALAKSWRGDLLPVDGFRAVPGSGVHATVDGVDYFLGSYRSAADGKPGDADAVARVESLQQQGHTVVALADAKKVLAVFAVSDSLKPSSREAIQELHELGVRTAMLSGDSTQAARHIARAAGIDAVHAELLPEGKQELVRQYARRGAMGMAGDGINDAPALAQADIGFAMGAMGTDTAIETADVALMDDDLRKIPRFIRLSRATHGVLVQNICLALGIKLAFLGLTVAGLGTMWMAVFADVGASLLVVANSLRLLRR